MVIQKNPELVSKLNCLSLRFSEVGDVVTDETWHSENVRSGFSRLYLIERGEGEVILNGTAVALRPGHAYLIPAGVCFSYGSRSFVDKLYCHFNLLRPDGYDYFRDFDRIAEVPVPTEKIAELRRVFKGNDTLYGAVALQTGICGILSEILTAYPYTPTFAEKLSETTSQAIGYILSHLRADLTVHEIAAAQYLSDGVLAKRFRDEIGCSIPRYVEDQIFRRVEEKLLCAGVSVGEVSEEFGFCDQFYFCRRFKKRFGFTPSQFRREMRDTP